MYAKIPQPRDAGDRSISTQAAFDRRVLIAGARGFIARHLAHHLPAAADAERVLPGSDLDYGVRRRGGASAHPRASLLRRARGRFHRLRDQARDVAEHVLTAVGLHHSERRLVADAARYWADQSAPTWEDDSHWCGASAIDDNTFSRIGLVHASLFDRMGAMVGIGTSLGRVLEWGVGGGANAVQFAPRADSFIAVDVNPASTMEAARRVESVCETPVTEMVVDLADPESAHERIPSESLDLFVCLYVLELVPTPEYGMRLMRIALAMLRPGGLAFVQIKYDRGSLTTRAFRRNYSRNSSNMTTYSLDGFWSAVADIGLQPVAMVLVPENDLDQRYAYLLLRKEPEAVALAGQDLPTGR
ncbi:class I SAM-dependent methyltransferase [Actinomycetospora sp. CA-101289]|uniref:class I SAM-dependent methyltransferase n=1 Tax=Actinomycetospora sp. CA-101289 TaxID=3239893 RepID=UPI003D953379